MNEIHDKVRQARRRLWFNRWLGHLGWSLAGAAGLFVVFVLIVRLTGLFQDEGRAMRWATGMSRRGRSDRVDALDLSDP